MPIRFHCSNCQQRLSVATRKAGQDVKCPTCGRVVRVPDSETTQPANVDGVQTPQPIESFPELGTDRELIYADASTDEHDRSGPAQWVKVPRYVLYTQGFLLGVVALAFFVFGLIVGSRSGATSAGVAANSPCTVFGSIVFTDPTNALQPDEGSVVILLPVERRPDEKALVNDLQPDAAEPDDDHPALLMLRTLGGAYARADRRGRYQVRAATTGRYYLLILSRHTQRAEDDRPKPNELAQLGRYFIPATQLLGQHRYQWQEIPLRGDRQHNVTF